MANRFRMDRLLVNDLLGMEIILLGAHLRLCKCWHVHLLLYKGVLYLDVVIAGGLQPCFCLLILALAHCEQVSAVSCTHRQIRMLGAGFVCERGYWYE